MPDKTALDRKHPDYTKWRDDETLQRASLIATKRLLIPFLVAHRFEDETNIAIERGKLGFGVGINAAWLAEIFGHLRMATRTYDWGPLGGSDDKGIPGRPEDGSVGALLWDDLTRLNRSWTNFFHRDVLEWMLSSPGALIVCDVPPGPATSVADAATFKRPFATLVPFSFVEDLALGKFGFRWIKIIETVDQRTPFGDGEIVKHRLLYQLNEQGETIIQRFDEEGEPVGLLNKIGETVTEINQGKIFDAQGHPKLPIILSKFGEHPEISFLGTGLLSGLAEIVIDLYNLDTEMREGYRDAAFSMWSYRGDNFEDVVDQFQDGSRLVNVGERETADLARQAGDGTEVTAGMQLWNLGIQAWAVSAKRQAAEAMDRGGGERSGVSLQAEFQLDLKPLLVEIVGALNEVERDVMLVLAQLAEENPNMTEVGQVSVSRDEEFQLENEAARISRLVGDYTQDVTSLPAEALTPITLKWLEATDILDLDQEIEGVVEGDRTLTLRDVIEAGIARNTANADRAVEQASTLGALLADAVPAVPAT